MNAWVLAAIICSATPQPDGSFCIAKALDFGLSREVCLAEQQRWRARFPIVRLECTEDPQLVTMLEEQQDDDAINSAQAGERRRGD